MNRFLGIVILMVFSTSANTQIEDELISYKKGACFGQCPMYDISVSNDGMITFEGKRFLDQLGTFKRKLSKKEFRKLKRKFRRARMHKITMEDDGNIMDAPLTTINYKAKQIKSKIGTPEKLKKAESYLLALTPMNEELDFDWTYIQHPSQMDNNTKSESKGRIESAQSEIIVELGNEVNFNEWIKGYHSYGLSLKKRIVPNRPLYLLTYKPRSKSFKSVLKRLKSDQSVRSAEKNLKIQERR